MSRVEEISRALNCRAGWRIEDLGVRRRSEVARRGVAIVNVALLKAELMMFLDFVKLPRSSQHLSLMSGKSFPDNSKATQLQDNS